MSKKNIALEIDNKSYRDPVTGILYPNKTAYELQQKLIKTSSSKYETVPYTDPETKVKYKSKSEYDYQIFLAGGLTQAQYNNSKLNAMAREKEIEDAYRELEQDKGRIDYERFTGKRLRK